MATMQRQEEAPDTQLQRQSVAPLELKGKVSLVTGSSRGIGAAIALALAKSGSDIVINYVKEELAASELANTVRIEGSRPLLAKFDVSNGDQVKEGIEKVVAEFGKIDILVNNAGINRDKTLLKMTEDDWNQVINVNLNGTFRVTKAVLPYMIDCGWGRIINMSSIIGLMGNFGQSNYATSKAGIIGFSKSIAKELASKNITVNVIAPGFTSTSMVEGLSEEIKHNLISKIPMRRFASPHEIGDLVAYLASPRSSYVTGEVITIGGGINL
jgi:3-oxoacyl-[acyl-carrier protein] reductase